jgi:hypothetical protein
MIEQPPTTRDKRALTQRGQIEERRQDETVSIDFPAPEPTDRPIIQDAASDDGDRRPSG